MLLFCSCFDRGICSEQVCGIAVTVPSLYIRRSLLRTSDQTAKLAKMNEN